MRLYLEVEASQHQEKKEASLAEVAKQEALQHEADAFRGVHLDPKAHHWDEVSSYAFCDEYQCLNIADGRR
jgi:hypothetical protein